VPDFEIEAKTMNILHYVESTDSRMGGVPRFVLDASRVMAAEGHASRILTLDTTDTPQAWLNEHDGSELPNVTRLGRPALLGKLFGPSQLREIRSHLAKADVLHLHCVWSVSTMQIAAAARQMGVPYVVSLHGMLDDWSMEQRNFKKRAFMNAGGRTMLEKAARVHSTAQAELDQSRKWFPKGTPAIIPYLMDLEPYRHLPSKEVAQKKFPMLADGEPMILFLSRIHYKKGCEHLIRAAAELAAQGVPGKFVLAGTGDEAYVNSLKTLASELGVSNKVHFVGQVTGDDKLSLYRNADAFVLPTSQENFGLVLIEAMSCGVPIVTTKGVDIWRDVEASGAATIVDQDASKIAATVKNLLSDRAALSQMGERARPWVFETYAEDRLIGQYENLYRTVAKSGGATVRTGSTQVGLAPQLA
jgi:glycosyltransferase involved in cell wall biosynthesis